MKLSLDAITADLRTLEYEKSSWVNDKWVYDSIISAHFSALAESMNRSDILFLGPSVTLMIKFSTPDNALECLDETTYRNCKYIFLCVNNNTDVGKEDGGSHWSLLFIDKLKNEAYHFDSIQSMNRQSAQMVANNLGIHCSQITEVPCLQQKRSFECGIHVLANANYIAHYYCRNQVNIPFSHWFSSRDTTSNDSNNFQDRINEDKVTQNSEWQSVPVIHKTSSRMERTTATHTVVNKNRFEALIQVDKESDSCLDVMPIAKPVSVNHKNKTAKELKPNRNGPGPNRNQLKEILPPLEKPRLTVASDSQGRGLATYLELQNKTNYTILNICQPGAPLQQVFNSVIRSPDFKTYSKADCVTIIAGTNNISNYGKSSAHTFKKDLTDYIDKQFSAFEHTNLIMSTIPYRYDLREESNENKIIKEINSSIRNLAYTKSHVTILDVFLFQRRCHTRHGLHINRSGKRLVARKIMELSGTVSSAKFSKYTEDPTQTTQTTFVNVNAGTIQGHTLLNDAPPPTTLLNNTSCAIKLIDADMLNIINNFRDDPSVAFAHSISGDFEDRRQMSAGVAVTFRKSFGRPKRSDCVHDCLTLQHFDKQADVYGLVTKEVYFGKPSEDSYNKSFKKLTEHFKEKQYKQLICPPMGCMRDLISPLLFAKNIVMFHRVTGASVVVVVGDERVTRTLRKGLDHGKFVELLENSISTEWDQNVAQVAPASVGTVIPELQPLAAASATALVHGPTAPQVTDTVTTPAVPVSPAAVADPSASPPLAASPSVVARTPKLDSPVTSEVAKEMSFDELQQSFNDSFHGWPSPQSAVSSNRHLETKNSPETTHLPTS